MPEEIECPHCGALFNHRPTRFKMPEPRMWVWEPTCTCFEDIVVRQIMERFTRDAWRTP